MRDQGSKPKLEAHADRMAQTFDSRRPKSGVVQLRQSHPNAVNVDSSLEALKLVIPDVSKISQKRHYKPAFSPQLQRALDTFSITRKNTEDDSSALDSPKHLLRPPMFSPRNRKLVSPQAIIRPKTTVKKVVNKRGPIACSVESLYGK